MSSVWIHLLSNAIDFQGFNSCVGDDYHRSCNFERENYRPYENEFLAAVVVYDTMATQTHALCFDPFICRRTRQGIIYHMNASCAACTSTPSRIFKWKLALNTPCVDRIKHRYCAEMNGVPRGTHGERICHNPRSSHVPVYIFVGHLFPPPTTSSLYRDNRGERHSPPLHVIQLLLQTKMTFATISAPSGFVSMIMMML